MSTTPSANRLRVSICLSKQDPTSYNRTLNILTSTLDKRDVLTSNTIHTASEYELEFHNKATPSEQNEMLTGYTPVYFKDYGGEKIWKEYFIK